MRYSTLSIQKKLMRDWRWIAVDNEDFFWHEWENERRALKSSLSRRRVVSVRVATLLNMIDQRVRSLGVWMAERRTTLNKPHNQRHIQEEKEAISKMIVFVKKEVAILLLRSK